MRAVSTAENLLNDNEEEAFNLSENVSEDSDEVEFNEDEQKIVVDHRDLWLDKQEEEDEKEGALYQAQNFSQALMEATYQKMMKKIERGFQTDLFSIPFIEDPDLELQIVPKSHLFEDHAGLLKVPRAGDGEDEDKIDSFDDLKPEETLDLGSEWAGLDYDFSMLSSTQLSQRPSVSALGTTIKRQISAFNFENSSLKELQNFERKKTVAVQDDLGEELKRDLLLSLPYEPDLIEQERYFETRPKQESKQEGTFAGIFLNMLNKVDNGPQETPEVVDVQPSRFGQEETHSKPPEIPLDSSNFR